MVGNQIIQQVHIRQRGVRMILCQLPIEIDRLGVITDIPVPDGMVICFTQEPLAALFIRCAADRLLRVPGCLLRFRVHAVPVEISNQLSCPLLMLRIIQLGPQEALKLPKNI